MKLSNIRTVQSLTNKLERVQDQIDAVNNDTFGFKDLSFIHQGSPVHLTDHIPVHILKGALVNLLLAERGAIHGELRNYGVEIDE